MCTINVPHEYLSDFIGTVVIDILHDAKGRGFLVNHKLADITDIISFTIAFESNVEETTCLKNEIFAHALRYFCALWSSNITALGIECIPDLSVDYNSEHWALLRNLITLPIRLVADRVNEDTFTTLGSDKLGIESQNYQVQKEKLIDIGYDVISFVSPRGINNSNDYFLQAAGIVDIINTRVKDAKIVLDMKSAAGLIRTITDPVGYVTSIPTFADPGYNMPGMSAIRKYAQVPFLTEDTSESNYRGYREFTYKVLCDLDTLPNACMLNICYFYGVRSDGLQRDNVCVTIMNHQFQGTLPRSTMMAETLNNYLKGGADRISLKCSEVLSCVNTIIKDAYLHECIIPPPVDQENVFKNAVQQYARWYSIQIDSDVDITNLITEILPECVEKYASSACVHTLGFVIHVLDLIRVHYKNDEDILDSLDKQWLPKRKGKLLTQIDKHYTNFNKNVVKILQSVKLYMREYFSTFIKMCIHNLGDIYNCIHNQVDSSEILERIPLFEPPEDVRAILHKCLLLKHPSIVYRVSPETPLLGMQVYSLIEYILAGNVKCNINLDTVLQTVCLSTPKEGILETAQIMWGKFTGDFGQIVWAKENGHIFASEDNNTSAMALLLHRICNNSNSWGNIHGLGDGGSVDIILAKVNI